MLTPSSRPFNGRHNNRGVPAVCIRPKELFHGDKLLLLLLKFLALTFILSDSLIELQFVDNSRLDMCPERQ